MEITTDQVDNIKACRTCGIHYVTPSQNQLKHLFQSCHEYPEIMLIRLELALWSVEVTENDGFPQYVCSTCIHKFEQVFQLRTACINAQNEFRKFYALPNENIPNNKIKTEMPDPDEEPATCDFIYVDELSDGEYDGATPFNIPHIPIKEEIIEAATVPMEDSEQRLKMVESAASAVMPQDSSSSCALTTEYTPQNAIMASSQPDAVLPISLSTVKCQLCQVLTNQIEYQQHMQNVHDIGDKECYVCGKEFKNCTSARFKFHLKWHTLNKQIKCASCDFVCKSKHALNVHKRAKHRKLNCKVCGKAVLAKKIKFHLAQHQEQFQCEYCTEAFSTENERENHIWQIHANEDHIHTNSIVNLQTNFMHVNNDGAINVPQETNMSQNQPQGNLLYKFICAQCEHRFMEQIDLETHVQEEHRPFEPKTAALMETTPIDNFEDTQNLLSPNKKQTVFDKYDQGGNEPQLANSNDSDNLRQDFLPPTPLSFEKENEAKKEDETELLASNPSCDENSATTESEDETTNLSQCADGNVNTFACAKCSDIFPSVEQLREHHKKHILEIDHQQNNSITRPPKSKFECNFCEKSFDLKFRLNRHIKKHKNRAPF